MSTNTNKTQFAILSGIALLNIIFIPVFDVWGGLFPSDTWFTFPDVIEEIFENEYAFHYWPVIITTVILVPSLLMLITSFAESTTPYTVISGLGFSAVLLTLFAYIDQAGADAVFDFDYCSISIGVWSALIIFSVSFMYANKIRKSSRTAVYYTFSPVSQLSEVMPRQNRNFCPMCGTKRKEGARFCGNCGFEFISK